MSEFSDLQERLNLNDLISYLIYGTESETEYSGTYEEKIRQSYDKIFSDLENLFPSASRRNDDLYDAILDFSITHSKVYLEMGLIAGFQLYKTLDENHHNLDLTGLQSIIKKNCCDNKGMEKSK